jgi:hypothetical protein
MVWAVSEQDVEDAREQVALAERNHQEISRTTGVDDFLLGIGFASLASAAHGLLNNLPGGEFLYQISLLFSGWAIPLGIVGKRDLKRTERQLIRAQQYYELLQIGYKKNRSFYNAKTFGDYRERLSLLERV